jgi:hypothetical protein
VPSKLDVASSSLVSRSIAFEWPDQVVAYDGWSAEVVTECVALPETEAGQAEQV